MVVPTRSGSVGARALQRAENSSIIPFRRRFRRAGRGACSSASRKFLNHPQRQSRRRCRLSACSSASRKFLNHTTPECDIRTLLHRARALQRAENSSITVGTGVSIDIEGRVLFSEPKIPQSTGDVQLLNVSGIGVLFSEPKIPQSTTRRMRYSKSAPRRALQRAENSSINRQPRRHQPRPPEGVLFSEPKIPQSRKRVTGALVGTRWRALQRAENSSINSTRRTSPRRAARRACSSASRKFLNQPARGQVRARRSRACSSASRKFLNQPTLAPASIHIPDCDDHASSFLSLPGASP